MSSKRLTRTARREQLLDLALRIVSEEGAEALTLARLAELGGVSRPIVYDHFETREKLLLALWQAYDHRLLSVLQPASRRASPGEAIRRFGETYIDAAQVAGPHCTDVAAALNGFPEGRDLLSDSRRSFERLLARLLLEPKARGPRVPDPRSIALLGALESLAKAAAEQRLLFQEAVEAFVSLATASSALPLSKGRADHN